MVGPGFEGLNTAEKSLLEIRKLIPDVLKEWKDLDDDWNLIRWLRARKMDAKKAEAMIRNSFKFRSEHKLEELTSKEPPLHLVQRFPVYCDGLTNDGLLVVSVETGKIDFRSLVEELGRDQVVRLCLQIFGIAEKVIIEMNKINHENQRITEDSFKGAVILHDYANFSYRQLQSLKAIQTNIEVTKILVNHFPGLASQIIAINCNTISLAVIKILRPIVESTNLKIQVFGENRAEWLEAIRARVPEDQTRSNFGGTKSGEFVYIQPEAFLATFKELKNSSSAVTC